VALGLFALQFALSEAGRHERRLGLKVDGD
jgi:hypothetical protein